MSEGRWEKVGALVGAAGVLATTVGVLIAWQATRAPRDLTPELEAQLERLYRPLHADRAAALTVTAELERFTADHGIRRKAVDDYVADLEKRMVLADDSLSRGTSLMQNGRYEEGRLEFRSAAETDPLNPHTWGNLAASHALLGDLSAARGSYQKALQLDPDDWRLRYNLALLYARTDYSEGAAAEFRRALELFARQDGSPAVLADMAKDVDGLDATPRAKQALQQLLQEVQR